MDQPNFYVPPVGPPASNPKLHTLFAILGEAKIRELVSLFYAKIPSSDIAFMFPQDLEESIVKSADFLIQVLGGPSYYVQKYGPPRMRARHLPFPIDEKARRTWLSCYRKAIKEWDAGEEEKEILWKFLEDFSAWMVNKASSND
ncbi:bacitracin resistance protein BacA [Leptospira langatensis]|uniref:Bacitracin resistance protein BacA n=1 Tax=Leptospira langatensis TaxID=2484983 RepID=A0A5F1ZV93_9LEPT|nr:bacitracin resistance protein BacA [Leptospira langatensis]TGK01362.1 bacitracin resistance protein BacA [Leptospira langatensis]TGL42186.1 bacitracin resistance protein BacA [Leptospira langatensis]